MSDMGNTLDVSMDVSRRNCLFKEADCRLDVKKVVFKEADCTLNKPVKPRIANNMLHNEENNKYLSCVIYRDSKENLSYLKKLSYRESEIRADYECENLVNDDINMKLKSETKALSINSIRTAVLSVLYFMFFAATNGSYSIPVAIVLSSIMMISVIKLMISVTLFMMDNNYAIFRKLAAIVGIKPLAVLKAESSMKLLRLEYEISRLRIIRTVEKQID